MIFSPILSRLFLLCSLCLAFTTFAQKAMYNWHTALSSANQLNEGQGVTNVRFAPDGNGNVLLVVDYGRNPKTIGNTALSNACKSHNTALVLVDSTGAISWIKTIDGEASVNNVNVNYGFDGSWVVSGLAYGPVRLDNIYLPHVRGRRRTTGCLVRDTTSMVFVAKINRTGQFVWAHKICSNFLATSTVYDAFSTAQNGVITCLVVAPSVPQEVASGNLTIDVDGSISAFTTYCVRVSIDATGAVRSLLSYDRLFRDLSADVPPNLEYAQDSTSITYTSNLAGNSGLLTLGTQFFFPDNSNVVLGKTDKEGYVVKEQHISSPGQMSLNGLARLANGYTIVSGVNSSPGLVRLGQQAFSVTSLPGSLNNYYPWTMCLDEDFNLVWFKQDSLSRHWGKTGGSIALPGSNYLLMPYSNLPNISGFVTQYDTYDLRLAVLDGLTGRVDTSMNARIAASDIPVHLDRHGRLLHFAVALQDSLERSVLNGQRLKVQGSKDVAVSATLCGLLQTRIKRANASGTICFRDSAVLNCLAELDGIVSYRWQLDGQDLPAAISSQLVTYRSGSYRCIVQTILGCTDTSQTLVLNLSTEQAPVANITASGNTRFCEGDTMVLQVQNPSVGVTYRWQRDGMLLSQTGPMFKVGRSGAYSVVAYSPAGCAYTSAAVPVLVDPAPLNFIDTLSGTIKCVTQPVSIFTLRRPGYTYQWYRDSVALAGQTGNSVVTAVPGRYSVQITTSTGCTTRTLALPISLSPEGGVVLENASPLRKCASDTTVLFTRFRRNNTTLLWRRNGVPIPGVNSDTLRATAPGTYTVEVLGNVGNLCSAQSNPVNIDNYPVANLSVTSGTTTNTICAGDSLLLITNNLTGYTYQWLNNQTTLASDTTPLIWIKQPGTYSVIARTLEGCQVVSPSFAVSVAPLPDTTLTLSGSTKICFGDSLILTTAANNVTYNWTRNGLPWPQAQGPVVAVRNQGVYAVSLTNTQGCTRVSRSVQVAVAPDIQASIVSNGAVLFANPSGAQYQWFFNGVPLANATNQLLVAQESGEYKVLVSAGGCSDTSIAQVVVGSITQAAHAGFKIMPNPVVSELHIGLPAGTQAPIKCFLYSTHGQYIDLGTINANQQTIDLGAISPGAYVLLLHTPEGKRYSHRLVKGM